MARLKRRRSKKLRKRLIQNTREAIENYGMIDDIAERPKWLICLSGGNDSYTLLAVLH